MSEKYEAPLIEVIKTEDDVITSSEWELPKVDW